MRIFFAHAGSCSLPEIKFLVRRLESVLVERALDGGESPSFRIVPGRLDHQKNWRGNWDSWTHGVATRKNATTGKHVYDAFVVNQRDCGRATASILREALRLGRPVFFWDGEDLLNKTTGIQTIDSEDWTGGWKVLTTPTTPKTPRKSERA
tara:strand:+ start:17154 stop:17606 length:453 start_codon:yes stop_codon:yes gene_type:complete